ncbi:MAG: tetratricopeptide repeat protein [Myxococcota bacterium]
MSPKEPRVAGLRRRAVESLANSKYSIEAEQLLERIVEVGLPDSDDVLFAHRQLAELDMERNPWRAALHLRHVIAHRPADAGSHALLGMCHLLLKNYRAASKSFARAVDLQPKVAAFRHNLGHTLDVGLHRPLPALRELECAAELAPESGEIAASLAQCLGRLGRLQEAKAVAERAIRLEPGRRERHTLLAWIEDGAPDPRLNERAEQAEACADVRRRLERHSAVAYEALRLAARFFQTGAAWTGEGAMAAALDWLAGGGTQEAIARRHGVSTKSLRVRSRVVRDALESNA